MEITDMGVTYVDEDRLKALVCAPLLPAPPTLVRRNAKLIPTGRDAGGEERRP